MTSSCWTVNGSAGLRDDSVRPLEEFICNVMYPCMVFQIYFEKHYVDESNIVCKFTIFATCLRIGFRFYNFGRG